MTTENLGKNYLLKGVQNIYAKDAYEDEIRDLKLFFLLPDVNYERRNQQSKVKNSDSAAR